jgi:phosphoribosylformylglycinamidine synthase
MTYYLVTVRSRRDEAAPHQLYLLAGDLTTDAVERLTTALLHDPVVHEASWRVLHNLDRFVAPHLSPPALMIEVAYKSGVTDNEAESILIGAEHLGITGLRTVRTLRRHVQACGEEEADRIIANLHNPLIQTTLTYRDDDPAARRAFYTALLSVPIDTTPHIARVPLLEANDEELLRISREGILSLDLDEMRAIRSYFQREERAPTDGEIETIAQTWSEHCSHKTFKAKVRYRIRSQESGVRSQESPLNTAELYAAYQRLQRDCEIDSLIRTFLMSATQQVLDRRAPSSPRPLIPDPRPPIPAPWVLSAFVDNAGIIAFGDDHEVSFKVETHNHPSALEPFGGANTGVGGVVRDVLGVSAQPIANTDVLCFGPLDIDGDIPPGVLHPRTVAKGVVAGVRDYGNKLGIPTVNGAVLYDRGYLANPLVFCGTVGLAPRGRHPRNVQPGDAIVVLGGRTGRDGIHGATFSSAELTHTTAEEVGSAVQIGDPITEKKLIDVILQARDAGLYSAITDCGAGGLSSAVGEMGAEIGAAVRLDDVPLKYAGLQPWEIWLSEAQERMVIAVPPQHVDALLALCAGEDVEATVIGQFTADQRLTVTHRGATLVDLSMAFLHDGRPQRVLDAIWSPSRQRLEIGDWRLKASSQSLISNLQSLLAHPNIASKEPIIRTYDHEVLGNTVIKPLVGAQLDGPGNAAVLQPLRRRVGAPDQYLGLAIGCGINPRYGDIDPYWMALACVDEALRNVVAVGGDPTQTAILDNFCWGDPRLPDRMAGLVRATAGCYDAALAYGTPFISGKDSLNNEYRDADGNRHAIPPTLLISALAIVPDIRRTVTMELKSPKNYVYLVGETRNELAGSHIGDWRLEIGERDTNLQSPISHLQSTLPRVDLAVAPKIMAAVHQAISAGLVQACHDLSEGGLGVAAAEMAFAGEIGLRLDLRTALRAPDVQDDAVLLFSETPSRFLVEVRPDDATAFETALAGLPFSRIGETSEGVELIVTGLAGDEALRAELTELKAAWQSTLDFRF